MKYEIKSYSDLRREIRNLEAQAAQEKLLLEYQAKAFRNSFSALDHIFGMIKNSLSDERSPVRRIFSYLSGLFTGR
jgi:cAMP phosphodiesterase